MRDKPTWTNLSLLLGRGLLVLESPSSPWPGQTRGTPSLTAALGPLSLCPLPGPRSLSPPLLPDPPLSPLLALPASSETVPTAHAFIDQESCSAPILFLLLAGFSALFAAESQGVVCTPSSPRSGACSGPDFIPSTLLGMFFLGPPRTSVVKSQRTDPWPSCCSPGHPP